MDYYGFIAVAYKCITNKVLVFSMKNSSKFPVPIVLIKKFCDYHSLFLLKVIKGGSFN